MQTWRWANENRYINPIEGHTNDNILSQVTVIIKINNNHK